MSLSAISPAAAPAPVMQKSAPAPAASQPTAAPAPQDTVSLSPAAQKAASGGDRDHDGDSH